MTGGRKPDDYAKAVVRYGFLIVFGVMMAVLAPSTYLRVVGVGLAIVAAGMMVRDVTQIRKRRAHETDG